MVANIRTAFVAELEGADLAALTFYGSTLGREIISLELSAREALRTIRWKRPRATGPPSPWRRDRPVSPRRRFVAANGLWTATSRAP